MLTTKPIMIFISLIILILSLILLLIIVERIVPDESIVVFANMDKLRNAMDRACLFGSKQEIEFELPEQKTELKIGPIKVMDFAEERINSNGDPKYVVYYEIFPPFEAMLWETYLKNVGDRVLVEFNKDIETTISDAKRLYSDASLIWIWNLVLPDMDEKILQAPKADEPDLYKKYINMLGKWEGDQYLFKNYLALPKIVKSYIKYAPCGENTLCLKTFSGVYKWKLNHCIGIKAVLVRYDLPSKIPWTKNFFLASPCKAKITIEKANCTDIDICDKMYEVELFKDGNILPKNHTICLDGLNLDCGSKPATRSGNCITLTPSSTDVCLLVTIKDEDGFCAGEISLDKLLFSKPDISWNFTHPEGEFFKIFLGGNVRWPR